MAFDFNQLKKYNELLELAQYNPAQRTNSLREIFDRDITHHPNFAFRSKPIRPTKSDETAMDTLFHHLTTQVVEQKTRKREYEVERSRRLHWVKHHIGENSPDKILVFSVEEQKEIRTYIFDEAESYVIVLSPFRNGEAYYLLTAYFLKGRNGKKLKNKYKRRLPQVH